MENNKITINKFWKSRGRLAIHCGTEEKADKLLEAFDKFGKKWLSEWSYLNGNLWEFYKENTCYSNNNQICSINYYKLIGYKIYEFEDVIFEEEKEDE